MLDLLEKLVSFRSITDDFEAKNQALDFIDNYLERRGMFIKRFEWEGHGSLVATTLEDNLKPKVLFVSHLDVMVADDSMFTLQQRGNKLLGRGAFDMKFSIAIAMQMVDDLQDRLPDYDFGIMITTDEEGMSAGKFGVAKLVEHGYRPDICITPDGGYDWQIETFAKGLWRGKIEVTGRTAHSSRPWEGDSAILKLIGLLDEIQQLFPEQAPKTDTFNVGAIKGGEIVNQIPGQAAALMDIRYMSYQSLDAKLHAVHQLCKKYDAEIVDSFSGSLCQNDINDPYIQKFVQITESVIGKPVTERMSYGASDARYFCEVGVPSIIMTPNGGGHHADNEWLDKEGFYQFKDITRQFLDQVATRTAQVKTENADESLTLA